MCLSPKIIVNRSRRFRPGIDKSILYVPCGHCKECEQKKMDDWFFRSVFEYKRVKKTSGFCWFPTLTYNNSSLPLWTDGDFKCPIFDKSHFKSFRNKLRVYLSRLGYEVSGENTIRYFYVCEYGGKKGRSHLHALLFCPLDIPRNLFKRLVKKAWIYGFVRYSPLGDEIKSLKGVSYVMKYLAKDQLFYKEYKIDDYLNTLKSDYKYSLDLKHKAFLYKKIHAFSSGLPHHCQSMKYGVDFEPDDKDFVLGSVSASQLGIYDKKFQYIIPDYYKRKYLYDYDKFEKLFTINSRGMLIRQAIFNKMVLDKTLYYDSILYNKLPMIDIFQDWLKMPEYKDFLQLKNYDSKDIALFDIVYRGCSVFNSMLDSFVNKDVNKFLDYQRDNSYYFMCYRLYNSDVPLIDDYSKNGAKEDIDTFHYENINVYVNFENGLKFYENYMLEVNKLVQNSAIQDNINQHKQFGSLYYLN